MDREPTQRGGTSETIEMRDGKNEKVSPDSRLRWQSDDATGGSDKEMGREAGKMRAGNTETRGGGGTDLL